MGSCAICGGRFYEHADSSVKGVDRVVPVDVYVPSCPPRPEQFVDGLLAIHKMMRGDSVVAPGPRHGQTLVKGGYRTIVIPESNA